MTPASGRAVTVVRAGPLTTVQDEGRPGQGALGIGRSGACDRSSYRLANRLVGNRDGCAALECTVGGLVLRADGDVVVATTGARCRGDLPHNAPVALRAGATVRLGTPACGLRTYLAVRGGIAAPPVLGSRATDVLAGLGPQVCVDGLTLTVGTASGPVPGVDVAPVPDPEPGALTVRVLPGPRLDWFRDETWRALTTRTWTATSESNRVGVRLDGDPLRRARTGELPSEGMVRGALQVPPSGTPVLFLADHPVTGGYPVVGYVVDEDVDRCAQLRPGQPLHLRSASEATLLGD